MIAIIVIVVIAKVPIRRAGGHPDVVGDTRPQGQPERRKRRKARR